MIVRAKGRHGGATSSDCRGRGGGGEPGALLGVGGAGPPPIQDAAVGDEAAAEGAHVDSGREQEIRRWSAKFFQSFYKTGAWYRIAREDIDAATDHIVVNVLRLDPGKFKSWLRGTSSLSLTASSPRSVDRMFDRELRGAAGIHAADGSPEEVRILDLAPWRCLRRRVETCTAQPTHLPRAFSLDQGPKLCRTRPHRGRSAGVARFGCPLPERLDWHVQHVVGNAKKVF